MTRRIYPRRLKDPRDLNEIRQCIASWRGVSVRKVPVEVKALARLQERVEHMEQKLLALEQTLDAARTKLNAWPLEAIERYQRNRRDEVLAKVEYRTPADLTAAAK